MSSFHSSSVTTCLPTNSVPVTASASSSSHSCSSQLPPWCKPNPSSVSHHVGLKVMNSLTRKKEDFITMDGSRSIKWYMCGPTVYAPAHMGHARTYLGCDIIRRILSSYFGYNVTLVMNITDIDDKIIQRSNEQGVSSEQLARHFEMEFHEDMYLLNVSPPDVLTRVTEYMDEIIAYIQVILQRNLAYESNQSVYFDVGAFVQLPGMHCCKLEPEQMNNSELLLEGEGKLSTTQDFLREKKSPRDFALWKRSKEGEPKWNSPWGYGRPGWHIECSVMASDVFAQVDGYDSVQDFYQQHGPSTFATSSSSLSSSPSSSSPHPLSSSSSFSSHACCMDIHSGGVDLKFPHHDNEMAQAEAHLMCPQWVNYFLHTGHLHIKGFKMSKSLKNFITIRQALENNTPRQIRLCFLLHKYNLPMDYGDNTMSHALTIEKIFVEFFHNVKAVLRTATSITTSPSTTTSATSTTTTTTTTCPSPTLTVTTTSKLFYITPSSQKWDSAARTLQRTVLETKEKVDQALKDDFDTPTCMLVLMDLVKATNVYMDTCALESKIPVTLVLRNSAKFITHIFRIFGLIPETAAVDIGFPVGGGGEGSGEEEILIPVLNALMEFRSSVRDKARLKDLTGVLEECDSFRDDTLPPLGIRLEDKMGGKSVWKLADPVELMKEREQRDLEKKRKEEEKRIAEEQKALKDAINKLSPVDFMKQLTLEDDPSVLKYSQFDDEGLPTHLHNGEPLNKNQQKKAAKEFQLQQKKYEKYCSALTSEVS